MLEFDKDTQVITMIAKDTGTLVVRVDNYLLDDGDTVYFTVNTELENPEPKIAKEITDFIDNKAVVFLTSEDTNIPVGTYYYDVQVNTADGRVDTIVGPAKFKIKGGVKF